MKAYTVGSSNAGFSHFDSCMPLTPDLNRLRECWELKDLEFCFTEELVKIPRLPFPLFSWEGLNGLPATTHYNHKLTSHAGLPTPLPTSHTMVSAGCWAITWVKFLFTFCAGKPAALNGKGGKQSWRKKVGRWGGQKASCSPGTSTPLETLPEMQ